MSKYIVVFVTTSGEKEAENISQILVNKKLAACVNIVSNIKSIYCWQGKIEQSKECLLVIKTKKSLFEELSKEIKKIHSYTVPEIIALDIIRGNKKYLEWIKNSVK